jgi:hypothetical protein
MPTPNKFALATEIAIAPIKYMSIEEANGLNDTTNKVVLQIRLFAEGPIMHPEVFNLEVQDGFCDSIEVNPTPGTLLAVVRRGRVLAESPVPPLEDGSPGELPPGTRIVPAVANAFLMVTGAWAQARGAGQNGNNAILQTLAALTLVPAGAVAP